MVAIVGAVVVVDVLVSSVQDSRLHHCFLRVFVHPFCELSAYSMTPKIAAAGKAAAAAKSSSNSSKPVPVSKGPAVADNVSLAAAEDGVSCAAAVGVEHKTVAEGASCSAAVGAEPKTPKAWAVAAPTIVAAAHSPPLTLPAAPPLTLPGLRERFLAGEFRGSSRRNEFNGVARQAHRSETIDSLHLERPREVELAPSFAFASTLHLGAKGATGRWQTNVE